jgi:16S rRNA (cytosine1402-N4)-methyltransferase
LEWGRRVEHEPVLADRVAELLSPALSEGGVVVDATLGRGGHAARILEAAPRARLLGIDKDGDALEASGANLAPFQERIDLVRDDFKNVAAVLERLGLTSIAAFLLDLGVSSPQLDISERGFSYRADGPLDMRMDRSQKLTADAVVNFYGQRELARVIARYGQERFAARIAAAIVRARPLSSTAALASVVREAIPAATRRHGRHPARRTFQAVRMEVNHELEALEVVLPDAIETLHVGGRAVVISYHSLEDRVVKRTFAEQASGCVCPPDLPMCACGAEATVRILTSKPEQADADEVARNPRAKAAKLRAVERVTGGHLEPRLR